MNQQTRLQYNDGDDEQDPFDIMPVKVFNKTNPVKVVDILGYRSWIESRRCILESLDALLVYGDT